MATVTEIRTGSLRNKPSTRPASGFIPCRALAKQINHDQDVTWVLTK